MFHYLTNSKYNTIIFMMVFLSIGTSSEPPLEAEQSLVADAATTRLPRPADSQADVIAEEATKLCPICYEHPPYMRSDCGHAVCRACSQRCQYQCPFCRRHGIRWAYNPQITEDYVANLPPTGSVPANLPPTGSVPANLPPTGSVTARRRVQYRIQDQNVLFKQRVSGFISASALDTDSILYHENGAALLRLDEVQFVALTKERGFVASGIGRDIDGNEKTFKVDFWFEGGFFNIPLATVRDFFVRYRGGNLRTEPFGSRMCRKSLRGVKDTARFCGMLPATVGSAAGDAARGAVMAPAALLLTPMIMYPLLASGGLILPTAVGIAAAGGAVVGAGHGACVGGNRMHLRMQMNDLMETRPDDPVLIAQ